MKKENCYDCIHFHVCEHRLKMWDLMLKIPSKSDLKGDEIKEFYEILGKHCRFCELTK